LRAGAVARRLFEDIAWSTAGVLPSTLERIAELGLRLELLPDSWDIDTPADLRRLAAAMADGDLGGPRTRGLLGRLGRLEGRPRCYHCRGRVASRRTLVL